MAYEVIMAYHLRMPFFIAIFLCFNKKSYHADFTALFRAFILESE